MLNSSIENLSDITTDDLFENLTHLLQEESTRKHQVMEDYIFRKEINFSKKLQLTSNEAVKQAIIIRLGSSILPLISLKNELLNNNLQIIPAKNLPIKTIWSLIWL